MNIKAVKGTRDFYPDVMRLRNWIVDTWRRVSLRNGFEEYDSPIFEYLDLFTIKSGDEIASQLFNFTDRGGRSLAIRPEITPSLARMVNAQINSLPRPIKWFSVPRVCRAENPQRGRLREFFQWNVDIIGSDDVIADAECIFVAVDFMREMGLTPEDIRIKYSSRALLAEVMRGFTVNEEDVPKILSVIDKRTKVPEEEFDKMFRAVVPNNDAWAGILRFLNMGEVDNTVQGSIALDVGLNTTQKLIEDQGALLRFQRALECFGIADWCEYDTNIVRGLAYYTGIVYEVFDAGQSLRAIAGGGRYDNLLEVLGGPQVGATGFGMGDVVLGILLDEKGKIPAAVTARELDYFIIADDADDKKLFDQVLRAAGALRAKDLSADFSYKHQNVGKQLKEANRRQAAKAVIIRADGVAVKDLTTGDQTEMSLETFLSFPSQSEAGSR